MRYKIYCAITGLIIAASLAFSIWYSNYSDFDRYSEGIEYEPTLFATTEKSIGTIIDELYESGIYPEEMPKDAIIKKVSLLNRMSVDSIVEPKYIIVPMPKRKDK